MANTTELAQHIAELPKLPKAEFVCSTVVPEDTPTFTENQMQSYALAAQAPLIERIKELEKALERIAETNASKHGTMAMMLERCLGTARSALASSQQQKGGV